MEIGFKISIYFILICTLLYICNFNPNILLFFSICFVIILLSYFSFILSINYPEITKDNYERAFEAQNNV